MVWDSHSAPPTIRDWASSIFQLPRHSHVDQDAPTVWKSHKGHPEIRRREERWDWNLCKRLRRVCTEFPSPRGHGYWKLQEEFQHCHMLCRIPRRCSSPLRWGVPEGRNRGRWSLNYCGWIGVSPVLVPLDRHRRTAAVIHHCCGWPLSSRAHHNGTIPSVRCPGRRRPKEVHSSHIQRVDCLGGARTHPHLSGTGSLRGVWSGRGDRSVAVSNAHCYHDSVSWCFRLGRSCNATVAGRLWQLFATAHPHHTRTHTAWCCCLHRCEYRNLWHVPCCHTAASSSRRWPSESRTEPRSLARLGWRF